MKTIIPLIRSLVLTLVTSTSFVATAPAQEVAIPDPGLNAAIRAALGKPFGPLTEPDLLSLTNLNARLRNIGSLDGLEAARHLVRLDLQVNRLTNFSLPGALTNLLVLDLSGNPLNGALLPNWLTNLTSLTLESAGLTNLALPSGMTRLRTLDLEGNQLASFNPLSNLTGLVDLDLGFNAFTRFTLPDGLTNLSTFYFAGNPLTNVAFPPGLAGMTELNLSQNLLPGFTLPAGMTNLSELDLAFNQLTNLSLPEDLRNLVELDLDFNRLASLSLPSNLTSLGYLHLRANQFTNFNLSAPLPALNYLDLSENPLSHLALPAGLNQLAYLRLAQDRLTSLILPVGLTNLIGLNLTENQLTNLVLPPDLNRLETLNVSANQLTSLDLPEGLTHLTGLFFVGNQITTLTLPPDMTRLADLGFLSNPLATLVAPESLPTANLSGGVVSLESQGVAVFTYPLTVQLVQLRQPPGALQFALTGPPGVYTVLASTDLTAWSPLHSLTNRLGSIVFTDPAAHLSAQKFYRAVRQSPIPNMVYIPPNTFTMGSPASEEDRSIFEGPQTTVTLTRGLWIGRYEVTQGEYLAIMNTNPSVFPGDLSRPVSNVSWLDATNYCAKLTERELAAGRLPAGSRYRLPTEAEWECAARAGTTTRFSYGDDPLYASTTNYAWFLDFSILDLTVHPVGQKLPNPWGLYDMHGNVWEWCLDWYDTLPGGVQIDPTGPASNPNGDKVMRGGAYDYPNSSCRSAARLFFPANPFRTDSDLGFRVVLVLGRQ